MEKPSMEDTSSEPKGEPLKEAHDPKEKLVSPASSQEQAALRHAKI